MHNRPKLKNRKSQKPTASPKKEEEEEEEKEVEQATEEQTAEESLCNSETGDNDAEEVKTDGVDELEESNVSFFNDSSLRDFVFEETEPEVGGNEAVEDAAVEGPALSEEEEVEREVDADKVGEGSRPEGEEAPSKEGAMEDHERETEEEALGEEVETWSPDDPT